MKISNDKLYKLCNKYRWFTAGDIAQYNKLFAKNGEGAALQELALIIWLCSSNTDEQDILAVLTKEADL